MEKNAAGTMGGAIYILENEVQSIVELRNVTFDANMAVKGGAIYGQSVKDLEINENCRFMGNKAVSGGAIYLLVIDTYKDIIRVNSSLFENNVVKTSYQDLTFPESVQNYLKLNILTLKEAEFKKSPILLSEYSDDPCYPGGGGAICLHTIDTPDTGIIHIHFSNLIFQNNFGYVGGAAMLVTKNENLNICEKGGCHVINVIDSEFYGNVANGAGGAIFAFNPEFIQDSSSGHNLTAKEEISLKFENNNVIENGYGRDFASGISELKPIDIDSESLQNINSNEDDIKIKIGIYDCYNQHIVKAIQYSGKLLKLHYFNTFNQFRTSDKCKIKWTWKWSIWYYRCHGHQWDK